MSKYSSISPDQQEELLSNFLIDSWSYSKVTSFSRNEKEFEKTEIYREPSKRSATSVAGQAYHAALRSYFEGQKSGIQISMLDMQKIAFAHIDDISAKDWKIQKTTPTVAECKLKANNTVCALLQNFLSEKSIYTDGIKRIIDIEQYYNEWLTINGVDIPLPCHAILDMVVELDSGKIAIIDHKSKNAFTDDKELYFTAAKQAIIYAKSYEARHGIVVDEVWFVENKYSKNRGNSPQLNRLRIELDENTTRLYEAILYEPLKRMIEAVQDPDYVYVINDNDNFTDMAELYNFWAKTMIAEIDEFNVSHDKRELVKKRLKKIRDASMSSINPKTIREFKSSAASFIPYDFSNKDMTNKEKIEHVLRAFNIVVNVAHEISGYSSNSYLIEVGAGVKIANIANYGLDIANALNVSNVRVGKSLVVYDNRSFLAIEVSKRREKDLIFDPKYLDGQKLPIGINNFNQVVVWDMNNHSTPHVLVCGASGSGKTVSIISTIEYAMLSGVKQVYIFDPKHEFVGYNSASVKVFNEIGDIEFQMKRLVEEMNRRVKSGEREKTLVVFDEFADAVASSRIGKELDIRQEMVDGYYKDGRPKMKTIVTGREKSLEENLKILLQKGRSLGFRILAATQRASVNVITGDAKVNFPVQICFRVPKEVDSKVVIDEGGAEMLMGMGDGLIKSPEYQDVVRFQAFYKHEHR